MRTLAILFLTLQLGAAAMSAATDVRFTCRDDSDYSQALCHYQHGDFAKAEALFAVIVERNAEEPETLKSEYFLARCRMQLGSYAEASSELMKIYNLDAAFYHDWGCDFLLGECRRKMGLE